MLLVWVVKRPLIHQLQQAIKQNPIASKDFIQKGQVSLLKPAASIPLHDVMLQCFEADLPQDFIRGHGFVKQALEEIRICDRRAYLSKNQTFPSSRWPIQQGVLVRQQCSQQAINHRLAFQVSGVEFFAESLKLELKYSSSAYIFVFSTESR